jgi:FkbM family methyltransferase
MDEIGFHTRLHRPGTMVDVGAHDGLLTVPFARLPGARVIAFEPLPSAFVRLQAACAGLGVDLRREALGARPGTLTLSMPVVGGEPIEQWASFAKNYDEFASVTVERFEVPVITLDSLGLADVEHLKVDAEGFEQEVLEGARGTLRRCRPVLSLELEERHRSGATRDVPALLDSLGYETWFWLHGGFCPLSAFDPATMQLASPDPAVHGASDPYVFTFYAWPAERSAEVLASFR